MTRTEHLAWCKARAIQELEFSRDPKQGVISMLSDLEKHPETANHVRGKLGVMLLLAGRLNTEREVRDFINGFN
ncbi:MAG TPA: hypothetical protein VE714_12650 [Gemmatimonadales bacterium]|jgi:hypothetical protein|nr:hypothetical protein [Gemmatimonadales bacterium]